MTKLIQENKLQFFISLILAIGAIGLAYLQNNKIEAQETSRQSQAPMAVAVQSVEESRNLDSRLRYPGVVIGDQEVKIAAATSGIAVGVNFDLGDAVLAGKQLVRIDDQGSSLSSGEKGFKSSQVQQAELSLEQAEESLKLAKKNYKKDKTSGNKSAREIAEIQVENAELALEAAINSRQITAPISGVVTSRQVSAGDAVTLGQVLATISKTNLSKVQFFVDQNELPNFSLKSTVTINDGQKDIAALIVNISPQADSITKRFLIEAMPTGKEKLLIGTVVSVSANVRQSAMRPDALILPLSAVTIGQNESYIFLIENEAAKKSAVDILSVSGETVQVRTDIPEESQIIVEGNKLLKDGDKVEIK